LIKTESPPKDVKAAYEHLNKLLREDDAVGTMKRGKATVINFPGRRTASERIGPFTQPTQVAGHVVRVGGYDETAHALVEDAEGRIVSIELTREQAREIRSFLYEPVVLRFSGPGRWVRNESAEWQLLEMKLQSWEELRDETLRVAVDELRKAKPQWIEETDPHALLERIRNGDEEVH
jgi:hypothetical protein